VNLARLRYPIAALRGRRFPEPRHPYRNEFQRDRDRIVHARAFRRLEDKTQVFGEGFSDHFRNRLTHSIEVSQIARTLASALGLDDDFTEALALAHDIGHPPFAHAGEEALDEQMRAYGERFDHNIHALRIVESFEQRYARFPGLTLTFEVREGMVKHSRDFEPGEREELDEYLPGLRPPLEAQLIDLADETAYNTADLDDGYSAGLFTMEEIAAAVPHYGELAAEIERNFPAAAEGVRFQEVLRRLIDRLVSGLIEGTLQAVADCGAESVEDVRRHGQRLVRMTAEAAETNRALKSFLFDRVYSIPALREERERARAGIARLFALFASQPELLPEWHRERMETLAVQRVVCDYIAGMTDGFFRRTAARLL
jgi:dGTPase